MAGRVMSTRPGVSGYAHANRVFRRSWTTRAPCRGMIGSPAIVSVPPGRSPPQARSPQGRRRARRLRRWRRVYRCEKRNGCECSLLSYRQPLALLSCQCEQPHSLGLSRLGIWDFEGPEIVGAGYAGSIPAKTEAWRHGELLLGGLMLPLKLAAAGGELRADARRAPHGAPGRRH